MQTSEGQRQIQQFMRAVGIVRTPIDSYLNASEGVQRLFALAGYWLDAVEQGSVLWVDDMDLRLHFRVARKLLGLFFQPEINQKNPQLIAVVHETALLDNTLLRYDQIWFMENYRLYPLLDFNPRGVDIGRSYREGQYGAV